MMALINFTHNNYITPLLAIIKARLGIDVEVAA